VALLLLLMSMASWVVILWKAWLLRAPATWPRARPRSGRRLTLDRGATRKAGFDRERWCCR
jgi:biopolymer transport protein ExbB